MRTNSYHDEHTVRLKQLTYKVGYTANVTDAEYGTGGRLEYPEEVEIDIDYVYVQESYLTPEREVDITVMVSEFVCFYDWLEDQITEDLQTRLYDLKANCM